MDPPIQVRELSKRYNAVLALNRLTLAVPKGSCVGFLGPNGAGKTTTIKILTNLLRPTSGEAYINGQNVQEDPKRALRAVGAVVETPEFYRELTPREILAYLGKVRGMSSGDLDRAIAEVIAQVGMKEWTDTRMGKFSKGMVQRIAIGQALLHRPDILILDEPSSGLDPRGMAEVRDLILSLRKEGLTIFMSSHLLFEVQAVCDRVAFVDRGKLVGYDAVENLAKLRSVKRIDVGHLTPLEGALLERTKALPGVRSVETPAPDRTILEFEGDSSAQADLLTHLQELGLRVHSFRETEMALERTYMDLVGASNA